jgi:hypothetical protein
VTDPLADLAQAVRPDIIRLIDGALSGYETSCDAMRWTPPESRPTRSQVECLNGDDCDGQCRFPPLRPGSYDMVMHVRPVR